MSSRVARRLLAPLAVALPLVPIAAGIAIGGGSGSAAAPATTAPAGHFTPLAGTAPGSRGGIARPAGTLVALLVRPTVLRDAPGGHPLGRLGLHTEFGSPEALLVAARRSGWLGVVSPLAGNGRLGWVPAADASLGRVDWSLEVSLRHRLITVREGSRVLASYRAAVGAPWAPTPVGRFAVTDRLLTGDPSGPYGCCVVALSAHAPHAIADWDGGDRIAIHATTATATIGTAASHGCLRVTQADARWLLGHIPLGTPVTISD